MTFIVDENVTYDVIQKLRDLGHKVISISEDFSGLKDLEIFALLQKEKGFLFTRDYHFTNPLRFPLNQEIGIVYLRLGNIKAEEEIELVLNFTQKVEWNELRGRLITVSRTEAKIR
jgi:predicted nuclease of predicted toxin-antitoxin system